jgi:KDO2-lipid IV(A) lauroyltransferase
MRGQVKNALERIGLFGFAFLLRRVPRPVAISFATQLGCFAFDVVKIRRDVAVRNVLERLDPAGGLPEAVRIARESYAVMARTFSDLIRLDCTSDEALWSLVSQDEFERFRELRDSNRGAVLVSGHFGNWELLALGIRRMGVRVQVLAGEQGNPWVGDFVARARQRAGIPTLSARRGLRRAYRALLANESLATLMDQDARRKGAFVEFLGAPSATHTGVLSLAMRLARPVLPAVLIDLGERYRLVWGGEWRPNPTKSEAENLVAGARHFNEFLERQVREHPENYFWAHRRWKTRPDADANEPEIAPRSNASSPAGSAS